MSNSDNEFERVRRPRRRNATGATRRSETQRKALERDGQIEEGVIVLTSDRPAPTITLRGFALLVACFMLFKGLVIAHVGAQAYVSAIGLLQSGTFLEHFAAFIMWPDALSQAIAAQLAPLLG